MNKFLVKLALSFSLVFSFSAAASPRTDLPALCYHQVSPIASGKFSLSTDKFRKQLEYLKSRNFKSLTSEDLEAIFVQGKEIPDNSIVITFDDGFKTVYDHAFPIMKEFGFKGIVCIYPNFIGSGNAMSWNQLADLLKNGWSVESHSMSHANLAAGSYLPRNENVFLKREITDSKSLIEKKLGNKVRFMVWPYGVYNRKTIQAAKAAGYIGAMTVDGGANYRDLSPYLLKRQVVYSTDDMNKFLIRLGMRALEVTEQSPEPGEVLDRLSSFTCKLPTLIDYSPDKYVLNAKLTGKKTSFSFDSQSRILSAKISSGLKPGNYFIDIYLRDKTTGITQQNGWLFTIRGAGIKNSY
ncbi:MAG: hypothetical protein Kow0029_26010 [Candidatus Rifleibacteriota bacterium]